MPSTMSSLWYEMNITAFFFFPTTAVANMVDIPDMAFEVSWA